MPFRADPLGFPTPNPADYSTTGWNVNKFMKRYICINRWYNASMTAETARHRVLAYVEGRNLATPSQIGRGLNMSPATVRYHLSLLAADGRIVWDGTKRRGGRGRPEKVYRLSDRLLGDNLGGLADNALSLWLEQLPGGRRETAIESMAAALSTQIGGVDKRLPAPKRLLQLIEKLNALYYRARWEAGASGPRILFGHCPYASIIRKHPELCKMDAALLRRAMDAGVEQLAKIEPGTAAAQCIFAIGNSAHQAPGGFGAER